MMYRIEPLYYSSPNFKKMEGEYYINLKYVLSVSIEETHATIHTVHSSGVFTVSKIQVVEMFQVMQAMNKDKE